MTGWRASVRDGAHSGASASDGDGVVLHVSMETCSKIRYLPLRAAETRLRLTEKYRPSFPIASGRNFLTPGSRVREVSRAIARSPVELSSYAHLTISITASSEAELFFGAVSKSRKMACKSADLMRSSFNLSVVIVLSGVMDPSCTALFSETKSAGLPEVFLVTLACLDRSRDRIRA